jgi:hypothetical protein
MLFHDMNKSLAALINTLKLVLFGRGKCAGFNVPFIDLIKINSSPRFSKSYILFCFALLKGTSFQEIVYQFGHLLVE